MRHYTGLKALVCLAAVTGLVLFASFGALAAERPESALGEDSGSFGLKQEARPETATTSVHLYQRSNYNWLNGELLGPVYGQEFQGALRRAPGMLLTSVGAFQLTRGQLPIPEALTTVNKLDRQAAQYFVVQLHPDAVNADVLATLKQTVSSTGGQVLKAMPVASWVVRLTPASHGALQGMVGLMAIEPYQPAFKISPTIGRTPLPNRLNALSEVYALDVMLLGFNGRVCGAEPVLFVRVEPEVRVYVKNAGQLDRQPFAMPTLNRLVPPHGPFPARNAVNVLEVHQGSESLYVIHAIHHHHRSQCVSFAAYT